MLTPADVAALPTINALLNAASAILLVAGYLLIRRRWIAAHKACMLAAFVTSTVFLISYLALRYYAGMTRFTGQGLGPTPLLHDPHLAHRARGRHRAARGRHDGESPSRALRPARPARPLDASPVALRLSHGRHRVLDAVPSLSDALERISWPRLERRERALHRAEDPEPLPARPARGSRASNAHAQLDIEQATIQIESSRSCRSGRQGR